MNQYEYEFNSIIREYITKYGNTKFEKLDKSDLDKYIRELEDYNFETLYPVIKEEIIKQIYASNDIDSIYNQLILTFNTKYIKEYCENIIKKPSIYGASSEVDVIEDTYIQHTPSSIESLMNSIWS